VKIDFLQLATHVIDFYIWLPSTWLFFRQKCHTHHHIFAHKCKNIEHSYQTSRISSSFCFAV